MMSMFDILNRPDSGEVMRKLSTWLGCIGRTQGSVAKCYNRGFMEEHRSYLYHRRAW